MIPRIALPAFCGLLVLAQACVPKGSVAPPAPRDIPGAGTAVARLAVQAMFREAPLPGARLLLLPSPAPGEAPVAKATADAEGRAVLLPPPGRYFLVADWRRDGDAGRAIAPGDRFGYFGGNPLHLAAEIPREIVMSLEEFAAPGPAPAGSGGAGGVSGVVLGDGRPVEGVRVTAHLRPEQGFRAPGFAASAPTGEDGEFVLDLPPGVYYLVARKRASGGIVGPMRVGDAFGYFPANPVSIAAGQSVRIAIPVTILKMRNVPAYSGKFPATAYIEGRISGRDGRPRAGVYAALYDNPELLDRPVFISDVTGPDGRYLLPVPVPGRYFLGARTGYGGSPAPGDLYGRYEGSPDHAVVLRVGDRLTDIDIAVDEVR